MIPNGSATVVSSTRVNFIRTFGRCGPAWATVAISVPSTSSVLRVYVPDGVLYTCNASIAKGCCASHIPYFIPSKILFVAMRNGIG